MFRKPFIVNMLTVKVTACSCLSPAPAAVSSSGHKVISNPKWHILVQE